MTKSTYTKILLENAYPVTTFDESYTGHITLTDGGKDTADACSILDKNDFFLLNVKNIADFNPKTFKLWFHYGIDSYDIFELDVSDVFKYDNSDVVILCDAYQLVERNRPSNAKPDETKEDETKEDETKEDETVGESLPPSIFDDLFDGRLFKRIFNSNPFESFRNIFDKVSGDKDNKYFSFEFSSDGDGNVKTKVVTDKGTKESSYRIDKDGNKVEENPVQIPVTDADNRKEELRNLVK